ncbi:MAG: tetratricopeptide repeat protein [Candidatus Melainabacteria bacterium]|nr:tetratricopeptide repeat protein [Candidatus Melainabacteria bacterium]
MGNRLVAKYLLPGALAMLTTGSAIQAVLADAISPNINTSDKVYSREKPRSSFYGTGVSGRMSEASALRFEGDQLTIEGKYEEALKLLTKAVQLDPQDPTGHLFLARALTGKLKGQDFSTLDEKLLSRCFEEWTLIRRHDADHENQYEAKKNLRFIKRVAKAVEEEKLPPEERNKKKSFLAGKNPFSKIFH